MHTYEFNTLLQLLQDNHYNVVILEGPRGVGKTTLCNKILDATNLVYYKTWGGNQKWLRHEMQEKLNLDLPQGTYFVLDFIRQASLSRPVLADRGNISAIAYQSNQVYGTNKYLHEYYANLMVQARAVVLSLSGPPDTIYSRRLSRQSEDEQHLHLKSREEGFSIVEKDIEDYDRAVSAMMGPKLLKQAAMFEMDEGCECWVLVPYSDDPKLPKELLSERQET